MALHNYQSTTGRFPPASVVPIGQTFQPWSGQTRLLPYLEEQSLANLIDYAKSPEFTGNPVAAQTRVATYMCPSEVNDRARVTPTLTYYPLNYALQSGHVVHL